MRCRGQDGDCVGSDLRARARVRVRCLEMCMGLIGLQLQLGLVSDMWVRKRLRFTFTVRYGGRLW